MNTQWNASADQFIEYALLQRCFTKPHHTWTDEERGAYQRYVAHQRALDHAFTDILHPETSDNAYFKTIQPKPGLWQYFVTFLRKLGVLH